MSPRPMIDQSDNERDLTIVAMALLVMSKIAQRGFVAQAKCAIGAARWSGEMWVLLTHEEAVEPRLAQAVGHARAAQHRLADPLSRADRGRRVRAGHHAARGVRRDG